MAEENQAEKESFMRNINTLNDEKKRLLKILNIVAASLHLVTSIAMFILVDPDTKWPIYTFFPKEIGDREEDASFGQPEVNKVGSISVTLLSGIFLFLAFMDHAAVAVPGIDKLYVLGLEKNQNHFRWTEYSLSASLMHVEIAILSGVSDIHTLWCIFGLTSVTMVFGALHEYANRDKRQFGLTLADWAPFVLGFIPHLYNWLVILCYFFRAVSTGSPPDFVWSIIFIIFFLDMTFAVNMALQWWGVWKWRDYIFGEIMFITLSLTSKQLLAWIQYGGGNR